MRQGNCGCPDLRAQQRWLAGAIRARAASRSVTARCRAPTPTPPAPAPGGSGPSPSPSTRAKGPRHYGTVMRSYGVTVSVIVASTVPATLAVTLAVWAPGVAFCGVAMVSVSLALAPAASVKLDGLESACVTGCDAVNVPADRTMISDALLVFVTSSEH